MNEHDSFQIIEEAPDHLWLDNAVGSQRARRLDAPLQTVGSSVVEEEGDKPQELIAICRPCHERHHGKGV